VRKLIPLVVLLVAFIALSAQTSRKAKPAGTSGSSADVNALMDIENGWPDAMAKKDVSFIERNYADDITDIGPDGALNTKQQDIDDLKSGKFVVESGTSAELQPRVFGNTAVVTGIADLKGKYNGQDISGRYRFTDTYVKENGKWKLVATQATKIVNMSEK
jgi:ketosteroid isomerase-like protein